MRTLFTAALLLAAAPAIADEVSGTILAYDRVAGVIVMDDKTVWSMELIETAPEGLVAGDTVKIMFETAGEDGMTKIDSIEKTN